MMREQEQPRPKCSRREKTKPKICEDTLALNFWVGRTRCVSGGRMRVTQPSHKMTDYEPGFQSRKKIQICFTAPPTPVQLARSHKGTKRPSFPDLSCHTGLASFQTRKHTVCNAQNHTQAHESTPLAPLPSPRLPKLTYMSTNYLAPSLTSGRISSNDINLPLTLTCGELSQRIW